jgi:hypothetical protein
MFPWIPVSKVRLILSVQIFGRINKIHKIQEETQQGIAPLSHLVNPVNPVETYRALLQRS